jgi:hypothetical protein
MESNGRGVLDTPHARGMTGVWGFALSSVIAKSAATKQSSYPLCRAMDCFASLATTATGGHALRAQPQAVRATGLRLPVRP